MVLENTANKKWSGDHDESNLIHKYDSLEKSGHCASCRGDPGGSLSRRHRQGRDHLSVRRRCTALCGHDQRQYAAGSHPDACHRLPLPSHQRGGGRAEHDPVHGDGHDARSHLLCMAQHFRRDSGKLVQKKETGRYTMKPGFFSCNFRLRGGRISLGFCIFKETVF